MCRLLRIIAINNLFNLIARLQVPNVYYYVLFCVTEPLKSKYQKIDDHFSGKDSMKTVLRTVKICRSY